MVENFDALVQSSNGVLVKAEILDAASSTLKDLSVQMGVAVKDLASTLLFVAIKEDKFIICHLGDGVIGYVKAGKVLVATHPENGEFANTTSFTTSSQALASMRLIKGKLGDISGFVMMSDGTENSLYNLRTRLLSRAVYSLVKETRQYGEAMNDRLRESLESIIRHKTTDDCSLAVMGRVFDASAYLSLSDGGKAAFWGIPNTRRNKKVIDARDQLLTAMQNCMPPQGATPDTIRKRLRWRERPFWNRYNHLLQAGLLCPAPTPAASR